MVLRDDDSALDATNIDYGTSTSGLNEREYVLQDANWKALAWLGHSDSSILQLYYHLTDSDSKAAMHALAGEFVAPELKPSAFATEGNLRAMGQSKIENGAQNKAEQLLMELLGRDTERPGFPADDRVAKRRSANCRE
jgi:hypothetical protein